MKPVTLFKCEICNGLYPTPDDAAKCESIGILDLDTPLEVGDVVISGMQGWWEGHPAWGVITGETYHNSGQPVIRGVYVVVEAFRDGDSGYQGHVQRYVLWTESTRDGRATAQVTSLNHVGARKIGRLTPEEYAPFVERYRKHLKDDLQGVRWRIALVS